MKEKRLYLVGYMASGKTTFGRALTAKTGWNFLDLDEEIEKEEGRSIPAIMADKGEDYFRMLESRLLKKTASLDHTVIACGGGTPCHYGNMEFMTIHGLTLWLVASPEKLVERIIAAGDSRPLVAGKTEKELMEFVNSHLLKRQPYYCKAQWRLSGEHLETEKEIEDCVDKFINDSHFK